MWGKTGLSRRWCRTQSAGSARERAETAMEPPSTPLRSSLRHKVLFGFGLALVLLSVVPLVVLHTHRGLHRWAVAVDRSRKTLDAGQRVPRLLISAENEWRALVFGKDAGAQERFEEVRPLLRDSLGVMEDEAEEDASRLEIVLELDKGVLEHFAQLALPRPLMLLAQLARE